MTSPNPVSSEAASQETAQEDPLFNLTTDEIPSFAAIQHERAKVFSRKSNHNGFERTVADLANSGEEGRRKGLGLWMLGQFNEAIVALEQHPDDDVAAFTMGQALMSACRPREAIAVFERLSQKYPDEPRPRGACLDARFDAALLESDPVAAADKLEKNLADAPEAFASSAECQYMTGRLHETRHQPQAALDSYTAAREVDPTHRANLFRLAHLSERTGLDELALECYETLMTMLPIDRTIMMNLGILYEDLGRDQDAAACYDTIVSQEPMNRRARLYLEDARAGMDMFYDEDMEKKEDRLNQILRIPITDFELSVRARNCLNKMGITTLGDLVEKTEAELLTYKNFGETSLAEIKEILGGKGLRLGMAREEAVASIARTGGCPVASTNPDDISARPVSSLGLSIRARRAVENLGCLTLGDITQHTEQELLGMPNFGVTSMLELKTKLAEAGVRLKGEN
ncbi:MAG: tetratricopeptide repeat protein [bacterium]|nr:tetratricopeptide repeat protein [bacterium]